MGYTHYWHAHDIPFVEWAAICDAAAKIVSRAKREGIKIGGYGGQGGTPDIGEPGIYLNGVGPGSHESFVLLHKEDGWTFCKTARKPYDTVVVAILLAAHEIWPAFTWHSDGGPDDFVAGQALKQRALAPKATKTRKLTKDRQIALLVEVLHTALFAVTADADNNAGTVDRIAVRDTILGTFKTIGVQP